MNKTPLDDLGDLEDTVLDLQKRVADLGDTKDEGIIQDLIKYAIEVADKLFGAGKTVKNIRTILKFIGVPDDAVKAVNDYLTKQYLSVEPPYEVKPDSKGNLPIPDAPKTRGLSEVPPPSVMEKVVRWDNASGDEPVYTQVPRGDRDHDAKRDLDVQDRGYDGEDKKTNDYGPLHRLASEQPEDSPEGKKLKVKSLQKRPQPYDNKGEYSTSKEQKGVKILITAPHAEPSDVNGHTYDVIAGEMAKSLASLLKGKGYSPVLILGDVPRTELDLNRPEGEGTDYHNYINAELEGATLLIDVHSYPPDSKRYTDYEMVVLDMPVEGYEVAKGVYAKLRAKNLNVALLPGYTRDYDVMKAIERGVNAVLIEHNEDTNIKVLSELEADAIDEYLKERTEDITTGNAGGALTAPVLPKDKKIRKANEPWSIKTETNPQDGLWKPQGTADLMAKPSVHVKKGINPIYSTLLKFLDEQRAKNIFYAIPVDQRNKAYNGELTQDDIDRLIKKYQQVPTDDSFGAKRDFFGQESL